MTRKAQLTPAELTDLCDRADELATDLAEAAERFIVDMRAPLPDDFEQHVLSLLHLTENAVQLQRRMINRIAADAGRRSLEADLRRDLA